MVFTASNKNQKQAVSWLLPFIIPQQRTTVISDVGIYFYLLISQTRYCPTAHSDTWLILPNHSFEKDSLQSFKTSPPLCSPNASSSWKFL